MPLWLHKDYKDKLIKKSQPDLRTRSSVQPVERGKWQLQMTQVKRSYQGGTFLVYLNVSGGL